MKKMTFFKSAFIALLACVGFVACSTEPIETPVEPEPEIETEPETYTVKLGWAGEILDVSYEPLTRGEAADDLYGIQVYSTPANSEGKTTWTPYAYGLFDGVTDISISLIKGYKYKFVATMVVNGKNVIESNYYGNGYYAPFSIYTFTNVALGTTFNYSSENKMTELVEGQTKLAVDGYTYSHPNTERFYGELTDYNPEENGATAKIDMKRTSFGAKFIVGGKLAVDGKLEIMITDAPKMELELTDGEDQIEDIFTFKDVDAAWANDAYSETIDVTLNWIRTDGMTRPLGTHAITFKRNITAVIEVNIDNESSDEGVDFSIDDSETGEMPEGEGATINDGELVDTEVETETETN